MGPWHGRCTDAVGIVLGKNGLLRWEKSRAYVPAGESTVAGSPQVRNMPRLVSQEAWHGKGEGMHGPFGPNPVGMDRAPHWANKIVPH